MNWGSKKVRIAIAIVVVVALMVAIPLWKAYHIRQFDSKVPTFESDSTKLTQTAILPAFASPMIPGKNNIWCSTFQLAWNEMKNVFKVPIVAKGAEGISQLLNTAAQSTSDLEKGSYYIAVDTGKNGVIKKILSDMARLFPGVPIPKFPQDSEIILYSYLQTCLKFRQPFDEVGYPMLFIDSADKQTPVKTFGIWKSHGEIRDRMYEQLDLLFWMPGDKDDSGEFALDLCKYTQPYQVVVAMVQPKDTLQRTYETIQEKIRQFPTMQIEEQYRTLQHSEVVWIPELFWQVDHQFTELIDLPINVMNLRIDEAYQSIRFRLDRSGVIVESNAKIAVKSAESKPSRMFIFNKPFLIYLKKRDAQQPFFVMWVDNAELLTPK